MKRIVSLLPAATEIAAALGLMEQVVGVFARVAIFLARPTSVRAGIGCANVTARLVAHSHCGGFAGGISIFPCYAVAFLITD
jgi:hypothetical protein